MRRLVGSLLVALAVLLLMALAVPLPAPAQAQPAAPSAVVVVGVPGLRWQDVTPTGTSALWRLSQAGAVGALSVKAGPAVSCAADGFLTLGAGARATAYDAPCGGLPPDPASVARRNARSRERAEVGALSLALRSAGMCSSARSPLALLAVPSAAGDAGPCPLTIVLAGPVGGIGEARAAGAAAVDALITREVAAGGSTTTLLVIGLSETATGAGAHLHVAIASGPGFGRGALSSASTGRERYVQLIDVAPTVLHLLGVGVPAAMTGEPWRSRGASPHVTALRDLDRRAVAQKAATVPFFVTVLVMQFVLLVGLLGTGRGRAARFVALTGTAIPAASFLAGLAPWWRAGAALPVLLSVSIAIATGMAGLGLLAGRTRYGPVAVVAGLSTVVLAVDLITGGHLQITSVTGYSPLVAGRFSGIGNVAFGAYAAVGLLALGRVRRLSLLLIGGAVLIVVDGAPAWGSDVGGVLALLPALVVLVLLLTGRRVSVLRLAAAGAAGLLLVTASALVDHTRPPARRTHLGRFVDQLQDGTAGDVLHRKATAVLGLLFHTPLTALLPLVVVAVVLLVRRPPRPLAAAFEDEPAYRHTLVALGVVCLLGFALNDSGAAVPALALVVVLPATVALVSGPRAQPSGA